jgi:hypothetical protein
LNRWNPCKRVVFIRRLRKLGFEGPYSGTKHQFLLYGTLRLTVPSDAEYSVPQLRTMLREVAVLLQREITADEWESLD